MSHNPSPPHLLGRRYVGWSPRPTKNGQPPPCYGQCNVNVGTRKVGIALKVLPRLQYGPKAKDQILQKWDPVSKTMLTIHPGGNYFQSGVSEHTPSGDGGTPIDPYDTITTPTDVSIFNTDVTEATYDVSVSWRGQGSGGTVIQHSTDLTDWVTVIVPLDTTIPKTSLITRTIRGFAQSTQYFFSVSEANLRGLNSNFSYPITVTTPALPVTDDTPPVITSLTASPTSITVAWDVTGGYGMNIERSLPYDNYNFIPWRQVQAPALNAVIDNLTPGSGYYIRLTKIDSGTVPRGQTTSNRIVTPVAGTVVPPVILPPVLVGDDIPPVITSIIAQETTISLSWDATGGYGMSIAWSYNGVDFTPWSQVRAPALNETIYNLIPSTTYYIRLLKLDSRTFPRSQTISGAITTLVSPDDTPPVITLLTTASPTSITVAWDVTGGYGMKIERSPPYDNYNFVLWGEVRAPILNAVIDNLSPESAYYIRLTKIDSRNIERGQTTSNRIVTPVAGTVVPPVILPPVLVGDDIPPVITSIIPTSTAIRVSWTVTGGFGMSIALSYDGIEFIPWGQFQAPALNGVIDYLTPATTYYIRLTKLDSGTVPRSQTTSGAIATLQAATVVPPTTTPPPVTNPPPITDSTPPVITSVSAGQTTISVSWDVTGGNGIRIDKSSDGVNFIQWGQVQPPALNAVIENLTSGTTYYVRLTKIDSLMLSRGQTTSNGITTLLPDEIPPVITSLSATDTSISVAWDVTGGFGMSVAWSSNGVDFTPWSQVGAPTLNETIYNLIHSTTYYVRLTKLDSGTLPRSQTISRAITTLPTPTVVPPGNPPPPVTDNTPPVITSLSATDTTISVSWDVTGGNGMVIEKSSDGINFVQWGQVQPPALNAVIDYLTPATTYYIRISKLDSGTVPRGQTTSNGITTLGATVTDSTPPVITSVTPGRTNIALTWDATGGYGMSIALSYDGVTFVQWGQVRAPALGYTIVLLTSATRYYIRLTKIDSGTVPRGQTTSNAITTLTSTGAVAPGSTPNPIGDDIPPNILSTTATSNTITVFWDVTGTYGMMVNLSYDGFTFYGGGFFRPPALLGVISSLIPGRSYYLRLTKCDSMFTTRGYTISSRIRTLSLEDDIPPVFYSIYGRENSIRVIWTLSGVEGTKIDYSTDRINWTTSSITGPNTTQTTIRNLRSGSGPYYVRLTKLNANGVNAGWAMSSPISLTSISYGTLFRSYTLYEDPIVTNGNGVEKPVRNGVFCNRYSINNTNAITDETNITPSSLDRLFQLWTMPDIDGDISGQLLVGDGYVYAATQRNRIYCLDADTGSIVWNTQYLPQWVSGSIVSYVNAATLLPGYPVLDIMPDIGISGTPVIDDSNGTMYFVTKTQETVGATVYICSTLHHISLVNGSHMPYSPKLIGGIKRIAVYGDSADNTFSYTNFLPQTASVPRLEEGANTGNTEDSGLNLNNLGFSRIFFNAQLSNQIAGLALSNGNVYICYTSHNNIGARHGWLFSYNKTYLTNSGALCTSDQYAGVLMGGTKPTIDSDGYIYITTGKGVFTSDLSYSSFGNSVLKLQHDGLTFRLVDYFTPWNQQQLLANANLHEGDCGVAIIPEASGSSAKRIIATEKTSTIYVLDSTNLGNYNNSSGTATSNTNVLSEIIGTQYSLTSGTQSFITPSYYDNVIYQSCGTNDCKVTALTIGSNSALTRLASTSNNVTSPVGTSVLISGNGTADPNALVWVISQDSTAGVSGGYSSSLRIYSKGLASLLYTISPLPINLLKFHNPLIYNGTLYLGGSGKVISYRVYSPIDNVAPTITITELSSTTITIGLDSTGTRGSIIDYSTDGGTTFVNPKAYKQSDLYPKLTSLTPNVGYIIRVRKIDRNNAQGGIRISDLVLTYALNSPNTKAPVIQIFNSDSSTITLSWDSSGTGGMRIEYSADNGNTWVTSAILSPNIRLYSITGLTTEVRYIVRATKIGTFGIPALSTVTNTIVLREKAFFNYTHSNLDILYVIPEQNAATVCWSGQGLGGTLIKYNGIDSGFGGATNNNMPHWSQVIVPPDTSISETASLTYRITGLTPGTSYLFKVQAIKADGTYIDPPDSGGVDYFSYNWKAAYTLDIPRPLPIYSPTYMSAITTPVSALLSWKGQGVEGTRIRYYLTGSSSNPTTIFVNYDDNKSSTDIISLLIENLTPDTAYTFEMAQTDSSRTLFSSTTSPSVSTLKTPLLTTPVPFSDPAYIKSTETTITAVLPTIVGVSNYSVTISSVAGDNVVSDNIGVYEIGGLIYIRANNLKHNMKYVTRLICTRISDGNIDIFSLAHISTRSFDQFTPVDNNTPLLAGVVPSDNKVSYAGIDGIKFIKNNINYATPTSPLPIETLVTTTGNNSLLITPSKSDFLYNYYDYDVVTYPLVRLYGKWSFKTSGTLSITVNGVASIADSLDPSSSAIQWSFYNGEFKVFVKLYRSSRNHGLSYGLNTIVLRDDSSNTKTTHFYYQPIDMALTGPNGTPHTKLFLYDGSDGATLSCDGPPSKDKSLSANIKRLQLEGLMMQTFFAETYRKSLEYQEGLVGLPFTTIQFELDPTTDEPVIQLLRNPTYTRQQLQNGLHNTSPRLTIAQRLEVADYPTQLKLVFSTQYGSVPFDIGSSVTYRETAPIGNEYRQTVGTVIDCTNSYVIVNFSNLNAAKSFQLTNSSIRYSTLPGNAYISSPISLQSWSNYARFNAGSNGYICLIGYTLLSHMDSTNGDYMGGIGEGGGGLGTMNSANLVFHPVNLGEVQTVWNDTTELPTIYNYVDYAYSVSDSYARILGSLMHEGSHALIDHVHSSVLVATSNSYNSNYVFPFDTQNYKSEFGIDSNDADVSRCWFMEYDTSTQHLPISRVTSELGPSSQGWWSPHIINGHVSIQNSIANYNFSPSSYVQTVPLFNIDVCGWKHSKYLAPHPKKSAITTSTTPGLGSIQIPNDLESGYIIGHLWGSAAGSVWENQIGGAGGYVRFSIPIRRTQDTIKFSIGDKNGTYGLGGVPNPRSGGPYVGYGGGRSILSINDNILVISGGGGSAASAKINNMDPSPGLSAYCDIKYARVDDNALRMAPASSDWSVRNFATGLTEYIDGPGGMYLGGLGGDNTGISVNNNLGGCGGGGYYGGGASICQTEDYSGSYLISGPRYAIAGGGGYGSSFTSVSPGVNIIKSASKPVLFSESRQYTDGDVFRRAYSLTHMPLDIYSSAPAFAGSSLNSGGAIQYQFIYTNSKHTDLYTNPPSPIIINPPTTLPLEDTSSGNTTIPRPATYTNNTGTLTFNPSSVSIYADSQFTRQSNVVKTDLANMTGILASNISIVGSITPTTTIRLLYDTTLNDAPNKYYQYSISITTYVEIRAFNIAGIMHGVSTILHLLRTNSYGIPYLETTSITDYATCKMSGVMIDPARGEYEYDTLKAVIDLCRFYKMRQIHLHLNDNDSVALFYGDVTPNSANLDSRDTPGTIYNIDLVKDSDNNVTNRTAFSKYDPTTPLDVNNWWKKKQNWDTIVEYAHDRGVEFLLELELYGRGQTLRRRYPYSTMIDHNTDNATNLFNIANDSTIELVKDIITQVINGFPTSEYFMLGTEESRDDELENASTALAYCKTHNIKRDNASIYNYYVFTINNLVKSLGKRLMLMVGTGGNLARYSGTYVMYIDSATVTGTTLTVITHNPHGFSTGNSVVFTFLNARYSNGLSASSLVATGPITVINNNTFTAYVPAGTPAGNITIIEAYVRNTSSPASFTCNEDVISMIWQINGGGGSFSGGAADHSPYDLHGGGYLDSQSGLSIFQSPWCPRIYSSCKSLFDWSVGGTLYGTTRQSNVGGSSSITSSEIPITEKLMGSQTVIWECGVDPYRSVWLKYKSPFRAENTYSFGKPPTSISSFSSNFGYLDKKLIQLSTGVRLIESGIDYPFSYSIVNSTEPMIPVQFFSDSISLGFVLSNPSNIVKYTLSSLSKMTPIKKLDSRASTNDAIQYTNNAIITISRYSEVAVSPIIYFKFQVYASDGITPIGNVQERRYSKKCSDIKLTCPLNETNKEGTSGVDTVIQHFFNTKMTITADRIQTGCRVIYSIGDGASINPYSDPLTSSKQLDIYTNTTVTITVMDSRNNVVQFPVTYILKRTDLSTISDPVPALNPRTTFDFTRTYTTTQPVLLSSLLSSITNAPSAIKLTCTVIGSGGSGNSGGGGGGGAMTVNVYNNISTAYTALIDIDGTMSSIGFGPVGLIGLFTDPKSMNSYEHPVYPTIARNGTNATNTVSGKRGRADGGDWIMPSSEATSGSSGSGGSGYSYNGSVYGRGGNGTSSGTNAGTPGIIILRIQHI